MTAESIDWREFYTCTGEKNLVVPCMCFRLLLHNTSPEIIFDFYEKARLLLGDQLTHYETGDGNLKKITARSESMVPTWVNSLRRKKVYYMKLTGCGNDIEILPGTIVMNFVYLPRYDDKELEVKLLEWRNNEWGEDRLGEATSYFTITLPIDHPMADPSRFRNWILQLKALNEWQFISATAGYGIDVYLNASGQILQTALQSMRSLVKRHIGLEIPRLFGDQGFRWDPTCLEQQKFLLPLIRRVNWLTMISDISMNHIGGYEWLTSQWQKWPEIFTTQLKHGLMIQAGPRPVLGTLERRETALLYRAVAKTLRPIRCNEAFYCRGGSYLRDACEEWLTALDIVYPNVEAADFNA